MKNILLAFMLIILPLSCILGQEDYDNKEIGVRMSSFDIYELIYKNQISDNKYLRLRTIDINFSVRTRAETSNQYRMGGGFAIGVEKRKTLTDRFEFILGYELIAHLNYYKNGEQSVGNYSFGAGFVIGFNYKLTDRINIGIETIPTIMHSINFGDIQTTATTDIDFNSSDVNLLATYRF